MGRTRTIHDLINKNPCLDCDKRHESCHESCKPYKGWKDEYERFKVKKKIIDKGDYFHTFRGQDHKHKFPDK